MQIFLSNLCHTHTHTTQMHCLFCSINRSDWADFLKLINYLLFYNPRHFPFTKEYNKLEWSDHHSWIWFVKQQWKIALDGYLKYCLCTKLVTHTKLISQSDWTLIMQRAAHTRSVTLQKASRPYLCGTHCNAAAHVEPNPRPLQGG